MHKIIRLKPTIFSGRRTYDEIKIPYYLVNTGRATLSLGEAVSNIHTILDPFHRVSISVSVL